MISPPLEIALREPRELGHRAASSIPLQLPTAELGKFPPRTLCRPPDESASSDDQEAEGYPSIEADRQRAKAEGERRKDHGKVERPRVPAMRAAAAAGVRKTRGAHPCEGDDPNCCPRRRREQQGRKDSTLREPLCDCIDANAPKPIGRRPRIIPHGSAPRSSFHDLFPEWEGKARRRRSRRRSNRQSSALTTRHSLCTRRRTDRRRTAWFPQPGARRRDT